MIGVQLRAILAIFPEDVVEMELNMDRNFRLGAKLIRSRSERQIT